MAPWGVGTGSAICLGIEACLFGVGVAYLLLWWRSPAGFTALGTIAITIFLGSAVLISPPTHYHFLGGIVMMTFVSAVACDRLLALADRWPRPWRWLPAAAMAALVLTICHAHLHDSWKWTQRPPPAPDGGVVYRAHPTHLIARHIRSRPEWRYYMVRTPSDFTIADPLLRFAGADSDLSDFSTDLDELLPVPPVEPAAGVAFIVLQSRSADRARIAAAYPTARVEALYARFVPEPVWIYSVPAAEVRAEYQRKGASGNGR
jgi:hypothetical protein